MQKQETPNLPFYFKRLATFLKVAKVAPAQQKELELAKNALKEIFVTIYGKVEIRCPVDVLFFPPIED
jgi:hypothetical protein